MDTPAPQQPALSPELPKKTDKKPFPTILVGVSAVLVFIILALVFFFFIYVKPPEKVLSSFIHASQRRAMVSTTVFYDEQAKQNFGILYKIPPKSYKILKVTTEDKTASVDVKWTTIDSSRDYKERTETVTFSLRKEGRQWKLDRIAKGDLVNFEFLFGN